MCPHSTCYWFTLLQNAPFTPEEGHLSTLHPGPLPSWHITVAASMFYPRPPRLLSAFVHLVVCYSLQAGKSAHEPLEPTAEQWPAVLACTLFSLHLLEITLGETLLWAPRVFHGSQQPWKQVLYGDQNRLFKVVLCCPQLYSSLWRDSCLRGEGTRETKVATFCEWSEDWGFLNKPRHPQEALSHLDSRLRALQ